MNFGWFVVIALVMQLEKDVPLASFASSSAVQSKWRMDRCCGPVSLYALSRLTGDNLSLDEIFQLAPPGPDGVTLHQLDRTANSLGFATQIAKASSIDELRTLHSPFIAHLGAARNGHFLIVLRIDADSVVLGDGIGLEVRRQGMDAFQNDWSGFVLVPTRAVWVERGTRAGYAFIALSLCVLAYQLGPLAWKSTFGRPVSCRGG